CFATCGNYFVASSTLELERELLDLLKQESSAKENRHSTSAMKERFYAPGGAEVLEYYQDRLFTQAILQQAIPPDKAREQVQAVINLVKKLGVLEAEGAYQEKSYQLEIRLRSGFERPSKAGAGEKQKRPAPTSES